MKRFQETYILHIFICRGLNPRNGEDLKVRNMNFVDAADIPLEQYEDDNDASGEDTQEDEENNEEPRRKRGKDRSYSQTHAFSNVDEFQGSEIYTELNQQMTRNNKSENKDYKIDTFVCGYFKKRGWKACPRALRVGYSKTSQDVIVWEAADSDHQHEVDADHATLVNYNWTSSQEEVIHRHMEAKTKRNELIRKELRDKNLLNGAGKLPTVAQVS